MRWPGASPTRRPSTKSRGTAAHPVIDFAPVDALGGGLDAAGIHPLFAMTYDPLPLQTGTGWQRWKDVPSDLAAWGRINEVYAAHYRTAPGSACAVLRSLE